MADIFHANKTPETKRILEREKSFHDRWASKIELAAVNPPCNFEGSTSPENRFILDKMGSLRGKTVLDLGCGAGESSVYFAARGAYCVAADLSPKMVATALKLAEKYNVHIEGAIMDAMKIEFPDSTFDFVYAANLLHHVNAVNALGEMHRVLKPGGRACFWDPLRHNPIINIYRRMAKEVRTVDEKPLHINIVEFIQSLFSEVIFDTFWICTLWIFLRFYLIERVDPNKERYWKKILYEEQRLRPLYCHLEKIDRRLKRLPFIKRYAWNIAVVATK